MKPQHSVLGNNSSVKNKQPTRRLSVFSALLATKMAESSSDKPMKCDLSANPKDISGVSTDHEEIVAGPSATLKDMPRVSKDWDEIKQQWEKLIIESRHHQSPVKRFIFVSTAVALVAIFAWYLYSTHSEVVGLQNEVKTLKIWMAVKMEKFNKTTMAKVAEVQTKVVNTVKESSAKETKLLKSIEGKIKH